MLKLIIVLGIVSLVASGVWVFTYLSRVADQHLTELQDSIPDNNDKVLLRQLYQNKGPKNFVAAWALNFFTPTASYIYQGNWGLAVLSFITLQGLGLWWIAGWFVLPLQTVTGNKHRVDQAYSELRLARPAILGTPATTSNLSSVPPSPPGPPPTSPDGRFYWDGRAWLPLPTAS